MMTSNNELSRIFNQAGIAGEPWAAVTTAMAPETLFPFQREVIARSGLLGGRSVVAIAPTGTGKSLLGEAALVRCLAAGGQAFWLVSTRALAREVAGRLARILGPHAVRIAVSTRDDRDSDDDILAGRVDVVVTVYEKARGLFLRSAGLRRSMGLVVADELHLLEEPGRGLGAMDLLLAWRTESPGLQIVGLSSCLAGANSVAAALGGELLQSQERVVPLAQGEIDLASRSIWWRLGDEVTEVPLAEWSPADWESGAGWNEILERLEKPVLMFAATRRDAWRLASALADVRRARPAREDDPHGFLGDLFRRAVGLHSAEMTRAQRLHVENALRRGDLDVCIATTTLAEGINTGVRTVVALPGVERVAGRRLGNLLGRAGRPGHETGYALQVRLDFERNNPPPGESLLEHTRQELLESVAFHLCQHGNLSEDALAGTYVFSAVGPVALSAAIEGGRRLGFWSEGSGGGIIGNDSTRLLAHGGVDPDALAGWRTLLRRFRSAGAPASMAFLALGGTGLGAGLYLTREERFSGRYVQALLEEIRSDESDLARYFQTFLEDWPTLPRRIHESAKATLIYLAAGKGHNTERLSLEYQVPEGIIENFLHSARHLLWAMEEMRRGMGLEPLTPMVVPLVSQDENVVKIENLAPIGATPVRPRLIIHHGSTGLVSFDGREVRLTRNQFRMLDLLARNAGQGIPYERIDAYVWPDAKVERQQVSYHRRKLEEKLGAGESDGGIIETHATWGLRLLLEPCEVEIEEREDFPALMRQAAEIIPVNFVAREVCL